uniref:Uncharacterized protein n=1 Tax=Magallana gigas TaxID=29159 RepID=K1Q1D3_MAGGI
MDGGEEESVKWSERDVFVRKEDEKSGCIDIHSAEKTGFKHGCSVYPGSQINNFTVPSSGLYSVYFHLIIRVPTNYNSSKCSVKISVLDKSSSRVLSQGVLLEKPLPTGGYESVVLFETVRLLRGSYDVHIDVSDDELLYRYPGSTGITVYKI